MPEVDAARLAALENANNVLQKLNGDPKTRATLETALKVHYPQIETDDDRAARVVKPQLEAFKAEVVEPLAGALKTFNDNQEAARAAAVEGRLSRDFGEIQSRDGFTAEGMEAIKKLMVEKSIADPYAAAARFKELNPAPAPEAPGWQPQHWNLEQSLGENDVKGLFENEDAWADKKAAETLNQIRVGQAA